MASFPAFGNGHSPSPTTPDFIHNQIGLFGNPPKHEQPAEPRENLLEYVRLDRVYEYTGRWVYKRTDDPPISTKDEWDVYSFSVVREWDRQSMSSIIALI